MSLKSTGIRHIKSERELRTGHTGSGESIGGIISHHQPGTEMPLPEEREQRGTNANRTEAHRRFTSYGSIVSPELSIAQHPCS